MDVDAYIPVDYIANESQKLDVYKRIAGIENTEEKEQILEELIDRFGDPPRAVGNLLLLAEYKAMAHQHYFTEVAQKGEEVRFTLFERAKADAAKIPGFVARYGGKMKFYADKKLPCFVYRMNQKSRQKENAMDVIEQVLQDAEDLF